MACRFSADVKSLGKDVIKYRMWKKSPAISADMLGETQ
jgi:hypothetical protein